MFSENIFQMQAGTLNQIYDKIKNCRVVKPPYEGEDGLYNQDFFLDKREGHAWFKENTGYTYTDSRVINGVRHYFYNDGTNSYIGIENGSDITQIAGPFTMTSNTPIRMAKTFGAGGTLVVSGTITNPVSAVPTLPELQYYGDGWVKITLSSVVGVTAGMFIQFQDFPLKGGANKIYQIVGNDIYIIGTNSRGNLPLTGAAYKVFASLKENIMVGTSTGLFLVSTNGTSAASILQVTTVAVDDVVEFNGILFYLAASEVHFSRKTFDDNVQFYPTDRFPSSGITKLISLGKILLAIGDVNKVYAPATNTDNTIGYVEYDVNYQGRMFSKYSYIYADSTFYIVQSDKQLVQIDIVTLNATTYDMVTKNIEYNNRGLLEGITGGSIIVDHNDRYINFCNINGGATIIYQYDKQYQHWLIQELAKEVYMFQDKVLVNGGVAIKSGYEDFGVEYKQEINFMINERNKIIFPFLIRTNFGLTGTERIDVDLEITYTKGANLVTETKKFGNYLFDATLTNNEVEDLIGYEENSMYNGNTVSLQNNIFRSGRFFKFKFNSLNRFIIGESYIPVKKSKYYINEPLQTN